jgi:antitoxin ParD1/3/4
MVVGLDALDLDPHFEAFIETLVAEGQYVDVRDVVSAALRLLQAQETRLGALRRALIEGEKSGPATRFDFDAFIAVARAEDEANS